jgi:hypothetical protein
MTDFIVVDENTDTRPRIGSFEVVEEAAPQQAPDVPQIAPLQDQRNIKDVFAASPTDIDLRREVEDLGLRAKVARADTLEEKMFLLEDRFGEGNVDVFPTGQFVISPLGLERAGMQHAGKPIFFDKLTPSVQDIADLADHALPVAGAAAGAALGSGVGALPAAALTATGFMTAKTADEIIDEIIGINLQSPGEVGKDIAVETILAGLTEGGVRALTPLASRLIGPNTSRGPVSKSLLGKRGELKSEIDPRRLSAVRNALRFGGRPRIAPATGKQGLVPRFQALAETVFGRQALDRTNARAIVKERSRIIRRLVPREKGDLTGTTTQRFNVIAKEVDKQIRFLEDKALKESENLSKVINAEVIKAGRSIGKPGSAPGEALKKSIISARDTFKQQARDFYGAVDDMVAQSTGTQTVNIPGKPVPTTLDELLGSVNMQPQSIERQVTGQMAIVPTAPVKAVARDIISENPILPRETKRFLNQIMSLGDNVTFKQMQNIRSPLGQAGFVDDLLGGVESKFARDLKRSVTDAMDAAPIVSPEAKAIYLQANRFYADNITKFDDALISQLGRDLRFRGAVPASKIAETLSRTKSPEQIRKVKNLVGNDVWQKVARERYDDIITASTDEATGEILAGRFANNIRNMGKGFNEFFGKDSKRIRELVTELAAKNGKIPPARLTGGNVRQALEKQLTAQKNFDNFMQDNFIKFLNRGDKEMGDAIEYIFRPGNERNLQAAKEFFGPGSREWREIQRRSMKNLLSKLITEQHKDAVDAVISGANFKKAVIDNSKGLEILLGKDGAGAIKDFANSAVLLTERGKAMTAGIVGANIALHPIKNLRRIVRLDILSRFLASPTGVRLFTDGLKASGLRRAFATSSTIGTQMMVQSINDAIQLSREEISRDFQAQGIENPLLNQEQ